MRPIKLHEEGQCRTVQEQQNAGQRLLVDYKDYKDYEDLKVKEAVMIYSLRVDFK